MPYIEPHATYFLCTIQYKFKAGYKIKSNSLRIYYSTTPEIIPNTGCPYVSIDPSATPQTDQNMIYKRVINGWMEIKYRVPGVGTTLTPATTYWLRSWMQLYRSDDSAYKKYRGPANPTPANTSPDPTTQKLFEIADYSDSYTGEDGTEYEQNSWVDFTDCIVAPTYDVNYEDVNEDWEDANYVTHRIVPRSKVTGSLELQFDSKYRFNQLLKLIKKNRQVNGLGYIRLKLQINNDLDLDSGTGVGDDLETKRCISYEGSFFMKFENNPWNLPFFGHYDKYEPLRVELTEA